MECVPCFLDEHQPSGNEGFDPEAAFAECRRIVACYLGSVTHH
jgi:hypothetical protein